MSEKITFSTFDPMRFDVPSGCTLCSSESPFFRYEYNLDEGARQSPTTGFCCTACAEQLLQDLRRSESKVWGEEERSL